MDPPSPIMRDLSTEQILEDLINDGTVPESPSTFLNPSGEGVEVDQNEGERTTPLMEKLTAPMMEKPARYTYMKFVVYN